MNHSAVDPHASSDLATPRACTSASTELSIAASWARSAWHCSTVSTSSSEVRAAHIVSPSPTTWAPAAATTPAGVVGVPVGCSMT